MRAVRDQPGTSPEIEDSTKIYPTLRHWSPK